jgi:UDP-GlcNAc:undecaprenyl-phosphate GlcNAc-1-phosphate transferase
MRAYLAVAIVAGAVTYLLTPYVRLLAIRIHAIAGVRDRDVHIEPTPRLGGIAIVGGMLAGTLVARQIPVLGATFGNSSEPRAAMTAALLIMLLGVADDRWELDALTKLAGQIVAAGVMVLMGVQLSNLYLPGHVYVLGRDQAVPLTVLLVVFLINAINFIDGLDGLAAGVVAIAAAANFAYSYHLQSSLGEGISAAPASLLAALVFGSCMGFLPHNFSPARIFMGDSGSMPIGLMLAASITSVTGQVEYSGLSKFDQAPLLFPIIVPLAVIAVPFIDLVLAVIRRTRARRSPFSPDKMHLHHRLLEIGHGHRRAVLLMYAWAALLGFGGVIISFSRGGVLAFGGVALAFVGIVAVSSLPRLRRFRPRP